MISYHISDALELKLKERNSHSKREIKGVYIFQGTQNEEKEEHKQFNHLSKVYFDTYSQLKMAILQSTALRQGSFK